jgi:hypothetical protein
VAALPEIDSKAIPALHVSVREDSRSSDLFGAVVMSVQHEFHAVFGDDPDWQKGSDGELPLVFMNAGISNLSTNAANNYCRSWQRPSLCKARVFVRLSSVFFELIGGLLPGRSLKRVPKNRIVGAHLRGDLKMFSANLLVVHWFKTSGLLTELFSI